MTAAASSYAPPTFALGTRARWGVACLLLAGNVLQAVEFALENPITGDNEKQVAYWVEHSTRVGLSQAAGLLAIPFLIGGFAVAVALCRRSTPRLAGTAAGFLTFGMVGLAAIHGVEADAYWLSRDGRRAAAVAALDGADPGISGAVLFVTFLGGAAVGIILLCVAAWRSPYLPALVPVLLLAFFVLDFVLGLGLVAHVVNVGAGALVAWAVVVGYRRREGTGALGNMFPRPRRAHDADRAPVAGRG